MKRANVDHAELATMVVVYHSNSYCESRTASTVQKAEQTMAEDAMEDATGDEVLEHVT